MNSQWNRRPALMIGQGGNRKCEKGTAATGIRREEVSLTLSVVLYGKAFDRFVAVCPTVVILMICPKHQKQVSDQIGGSRPS